VDILFVDKEHFFEKLHKIVSPSSPVGTTKLLFGRKREIESIEEALYAKGRHCFIYGERGVGKSSLAYSIANIFQADDKPYIIVNCAKASTFESIMNFIIYELTDGKELTSDTRSLGGKIGILGVNGTASNKKTFKQKSIEAYDEGTFASLLAKYSREYSSTTVIVIDEFDTILDLAEKEKFAVLIKALSNIDCSVKLIFTGIATSLTDLLGGHGSSVRQIHQEFIQPLSWDGRFDIIDRAFREFDLKLPEDIRFKISGLSDGYPSYIHLICEKLITESFKNGFEKPVDFDQFLKALDKAIDSIAEDIRKDYDKATNGRDELYHYVLWAMADSADQIRHIDHILDSYEMVCRAVSVPQMDKEKFEKIFKGLRTQSSGNIVVRGLDKRPKWWRFKESLVRGLIRMYAEKNGVVLDFQRNYASITGHVSQKSSQREYRPLTQVENKAAKWRGDSDY
jgi:GTPase SAR1 family protein